MTAAFIIVHGHDYWGFSKRSQETDGRGRSEGAYEEKVRRIRPPSAFVLALAPARESQWLSVWNARGEHYTEGEDLAHLDERR